MKRKNNMHPVVYAIRHHAKALEPLVMELSLALNLECPGHVIKSTRLDPGSNSWFTELPDGRQFFFTGFLSPRPMIRVRRQYRNPKQNRITLTKRSDVWEWVKSL